MKELKIVINNPTGLHARPAKIFVNLAKEFKSDIRVKHGNKKANAKSLISMLTLGVVSGSEIHIRVSGDDEAEALRALEEVILSGLGEGDMIEAAAEALQVTPASPEKKAEEQAAPAEIATDGSRIRGVAAAPGIAIGPVFQLRHSTLKINGKFESLEAETARLNTAVEQARVQIEGLKQKMLQDTSASEAAIFDVHMELLDDPELRETVAEKIAQQTSAAQAWQEVIEFQASTMAALDDPLLAARGADLRDVGYRVLRLMVGADEDTQMPDHPVVVVAEDLTPSDTASLDKGKVLGFCTASGGPTSHSAIIARALGLPAVVGAGGAVLALANQMTVILDGGTGVVILDPDESAVAEAQAANERRKSRLQAAAKAALDPATTQDGHQVEVVANVGGRADAAKAVAAGAEGVGLLRTEFLFLDREVPPTEEEQFEVYRDITTSLEGYPVIVRTLDIGGDKPLPYIDVPHEENPFLGERGVRLTLRRPEIMRQQLRAILRAASVGPIRIMFPMVSDVQEWRAARKLVNEVRAALDAPAVDLGIMIEVPSAALMADIFAPEVDFFSIGTNDLTQYTMAMDRMHPVMAGQADGLHPAVLRLISKTVEAAHAAGKWVGVCGELGSDPQAVPLLVGLGVDELSVSVPSIPSVKAQVRSLTLKQAQELAQKALACGTAEEVRTLVPKE